jgi:hypothetical protein
VWEKLTALLTVRAPGMSFSRPRSEVRLKDKAPGVGANAIDAHTQDKVSRLDILDADLMNQVLTEKARPGQAYLVLPGDLSDQSG